MSQRTAEQIKAEISRLQDELFMVEVTDGFVERLGKCKSTGGTHEWRVQSWEKNIPYEPIYMWGSFRPIAHEPYGVHEKAQMVCHCGARVTYEEGGR